MAVDVYSALMIVYSTLITSTLVIGHIFFCRKSHVLVFKLLRGLQQSLSYRIPWYSVSPLP